MKFLFTLALFMMSALVTFAGSWPQGKGNGYFQVSFTYLRYHEVINDFSLSEGYEVYELKRSVKDHTLNGYFEYGITDQLTAVGTVPYKIMGTGEELLEVEDDRFSQDTAKAGSLNALGNIDLGLRYTFHNKKFVWSAQIMAGMSTASYQHATGLRTGYDAWCFTPRIQVGRGWDKTYFSASVGYRYKTNGYAQDLVTDNEIGYKWDRGDGKKTWFIFPFGANIPVTSGSYDDRNSIHTGTYRDEEGWVDFGLKVNHYFNENLALNFSTMGAMWARHGGNMMTTTVGVSWEW